MQFRTFPQTDLSVSRLCLGTMTFGSQTNEADAARMVDICLDAGINFFDTANVYNQGLSEEITGRCLGKRRSKVVLASKVRGAMGDPVEYEGLSRAAIRRGLEDSLRRLGTDHLDVYYLHQPDYNTPIEETLEALEELRREGKVRYTATSNYAAWQIAEMFAICEKQGYAPPRISQPMYNALARGIEQEYIPFARRYGVGLAVYNPLAGGLLTGKQSPESGPLPGTRFDGNERYVNRYWHGPYFEAVESMKTLAVKYDRTPVELALVWLMQQEAVDSVILGASKVEHLEMNIAAAQGEPLPDEALAECDEVWEELHGPTPNYNR